MKFKVLEPKGKTEDKDTKLNESEKRCEIVCEGDLFEVKLSSKLFVDPYGFAPAGLGMGWEGGYYTLIDQKTGVMSGGGTLLAGQSSSMTHRICASGSSRLGLESGLKLELRLGLVFELELELF
jgi:hypothetical protein